MQNSRGGVGTEDFQFFRKYSLSYPLVLDTRSKLKWKGEVATKDFRGIFSQVPHFYPLVLDTRFQTQGVGTEDFQIIFSQVSHFLSPCPGHDIPNSRGVETEDFQIIFSQVLHLLSLVLDTRFQTLGRVGMEDFQIFSASISFCIPLFWTRDSKLKLSNVWEGTEDFRTIFSQVPLFYPLLLDTRFPSRHTDGQFSTQLAHNYFHKYKSPIFHLPDGR